MGMVTRLSVEPEARFSSWICEITNQWETVGKGGWDWENSADGLCVPGRRGGRHGRQKTILATPYDHTS